MYLVPAQIKAAKAVTLRGVSYAKDQALTAAQIAGLPKLGALISKGVLYTVPDVYGRNPKLRGTSLKRIGLTGTYDRPSGRPAPTYVAPKARKVVVGGSADFTVTASVSVRTVTLTLTGGDPPFSIAWGDGATSTVKGRTSTHTYSTTDTFTVTATGQNTDTATASVTTTDPEA